MAWHEMARACARHILWKITGGRSGAGDILYHPPVSAVPAAELVSPLVTSVLFVEQACCFTVVFCAFYRISFDITRAVHLPCLRLLPLSSSAVGIPGLFAHLFCILSECDISPVVCLPLLVRTHSVRRCDA